MRFQKDTKITSCSQKKQLVTFTAIPHKLRLFKKALLRCGSNDLCHQICRQLFIAGKCHGEGSLALCHLPQLQCITAAVASRIIETYEIDAEKEDMDVLLSNHYTLTTYGGPVITCIAKLPAVEALDTLARIESKEKQKSLTWSRINMLRKLCQKIKKRNADVILAVIPQYNKAIYLNQNGRIDKHINNINPLCDTLLFFVKDTPEGRAFVKEQKFLVFPFLSPEEELQ